MEVLHDKSISQSDRLVRFKMSEKKVRVRKYKKEDKKKLLDLRDEVWGEPNPLRNRAVWEWEFEKNPLNPNGLPSSLIAEVEGEVVGLLGTLSARVKVSDKIEDMVWIVDFMTHPDYRGAGFKLALKSKSIAPLALAVPNPASYGIGKGIKWFDIEPFYTSVSIVNGEAFIRSKLNSKVISKLIGFAWRILRSLLRPKKKPGLEIEIADGFDDWVDDLWETASKDYPFILVRKKEWLKWRFEECPQRDYTILNVKRDNRNVGYMVIRKKSKKGLRYGSIVDFLVRRDDRKALEALLWKATKMLEDDGVDVINCIEPTVKELKNSFRKYGFIFKKKWAVMGWSNLKNVDKADLIDTSNWFITMADSDIDIVW